MRRAVCKIIGWRVVTMTGTDGGAEPELTCCIAGKNAIAVEGAAYLRQHYPSATLLGCINRTDMGEDGWQPSFGKWCRDNDVPVLALDALYDMDGLLFCSLEFDQLIRTGKFRSDRLYNIHFSHLPEYKGMYTSAMPILNGETRSGVTLHRIDDGIDTGDIIAQTRFDIGQDWTARDLYFKYLDAGTRLFTDHLDSLIRRTYTARPQPAVGASYYPRAAIDYGNLEIDLNKTAFEILCQVRAFTFEEYQLVSVLGRPVKGGRILTRKSTRKAGHIVAEADDHIELATIDYDLRLFLARAPKEV